MTQSKKERCSQLEVLRNVKWEMWSEKGEVRKVKWEMRSEKCEVRNVKWEMWDKVEQSKVEKVKCNELKLKNSISQSDDDDDRMSGFSATTDSGIYVARTSDR